MRAQALSLLKFLRSSPQFAVPIYQRTYSWSIGHCEQLWNDVLRVGGNPRVSAHFIGSIVVTVHGVFLLTDPPAACGTV